jgi:hypothetical protein
MDWEHTKVSKVKPKEGKSNSSQIECYNCGEKGHISRNCANKSKIKRTKVGRAAKLKSATGCKCQVPAPEPTTESDSDSDSNSDSGKE